MYVCMYVCTYIYIYTFDIYIYIYVYIYIYIYLCMYTCRSSIYRPSIYIYIERERYRYRYMYIYIYVHTHILGGGRSPSLGLDYYESLYVTIMIAMNYVYSMRMYLYPISLLGLLCIMGADLPARAWTISTRTDTNDSNTNRIGIPNKMCTDRGGGSPSLGLLSSLLVLLQHHSICSYTGSYIITSILLFIAVYAV